MGDRHRAAIVALVVATAIGATRAIVITVPGVVMAHVTMLHGGVVVRFVAANRGNSRPRAAHLACQHQ
ncbi:hypothetical protein [Spectribacter hydrogenoxidans]|uniref:Secreted protein n=1 Tax=Spectribacter hydrogenoxidans TaxID=3075608 RepID=A0ABU3C3L5_9GAMM|nr:hypothetical protein [Salinisphaera sp. W335]MDT0636112.1 hypothetical protein [Salinisphaera sp. W335]